MYTVSLSLEYSPVDVENWYVQILHPVRTLIRTSRVQDRRAVTSYLESPFQFDIEVLLHCGAEGTLSTISTSHPSHSRLIHTPYYHIDQNSVTGYTMNESPTTLQFIAETALPTRHGTLRVRAYRNDHTGHEPIAIVSEKIHPVGFPVRVHDACFTSEVLGSVKCDCKEQLDFAIQYIQKHSGVVVYMHQEGRGIGLANKIAAYHLQEHGVDTVDANRQLHLPDDAREYHDAVAILRDLGIQSIQLLTNNPRKIERLSGLGITVDKRIPIEIPASAASSVYLETKRKRMGHMLSPTRNE